MMMANEILRLTFSKSIGLTICADGSATYRKNDGNRLEHFVNYSSILTALIQEAGRVCVNYASDLFISWESLLDETERKMKEKEDFMITTFFGFRDQGVDGPFYINEKISDEKTYGDPYESIYRLDINAKHSVDTMGVSSYQVGLLLYPVYRSEMTVPVYTACKKSDGTKVSGYLLPAGYDCYLIPEDGITLMGTEKAEAKLVSVDLATIRRC